MRMFLVIRGVMLALGVLLAAVLIARGNVVIGVIVGALTLCRAALLAVRIRRRQEFRRRFGARFEARRATGDRPFTGR